MNGEKGATTKRKEKSKLKSLSVVLPAFHVAVGYNLQIVKNPLNQGQTSATLIFADKLDFVSAFTTTCSQSVS